MLQHFPRPNDLVRGFETSLLLLRAKWRTIRTPKAKLFIWIGAILVLIAIGGSSHAGHFIKTVAQQGGDTAAQQFAMTYLASFMRGELGAIGAGVLGLSVLSSLIAPFTGGMTTSLISERDLVSFGASRWHKFSDSVIGQAVSSISILQLISLSGITSILTLQGGRGMGLALTWGVWAVLVLLSVLASWTAEYLYRKFGLRIRAVILITTALIIGTVILLDPNHGTTLFGLGSQYAVLVQTIGVNLDPQQIALAFGIVAAAGLLAFYAAACMCSLALCLPEFGAQRKERARRKVLTMPITSKPLVELFKMLSFSLLRSKDARKPLIAAALLGSVLLAVSGGTYTIATAFTIMIPLVIALAWGANIFGVLGGGLAWLTSQPKLVMKLPWFVFLIQIIFTSSLFVLVWTPALVLGRVPWDNMPSVILSALCTTVLIARSSLHKSIFSPHPTHFGSRNETALSPTTTLAYTFRFALWGGMCGVIVLTLEDLMAQLSIAFLVVVWSCLRMTRIQEKWADPETRRKVIHVVAQD